MQAAMAGVIGEHDLTHSMIFSLIDTKFLSESIFLNALVNTLPDLAWLKDVNGVYLACNPRFESFFGAKQKEIIGKTDYDFVDKDLADFFRKNDRLAMEKDGPSINEEWVIFANDGHRELLETIKTPMRDVQGTLVGIGCCA
jgi:PAS domain S-box-containing protein